MREDMSKVIVERPRPGSSRHVPRRFGRMDSRHVVVDEDEDDAFPAQIGHKRAAVLSGERKWLNENLAPLRRYLERQAGRPWDDVWSEICATICVDNAVQKHVRDHVQDFVAVRTILRDGDVLVNSRWGGLRPLQHRSSLRLYVDPETGVLRPIPSRQSWNATRKLKQIEEDVHAAHRMRVIDRDRQLHLLADGNWWEITLAATPAWSRSGASGVPRDIGDVVERAAMSKVAREQRYRRHGVYAVAKRPLSRREIRALKLRSDHAS